MLLVFFHSHVLSAECRSFWRSSVSISSPKIHMWFLCCCPSWPNQKIEMRARLIQSHKQIIVCESISFFLLILFFYCNTLKNVFIYANIKKRKKERNFKLITSAVCPAVCYYKMFAPGFITANFLLAIFLLFMLFFVYSHCLKNNLVLY